METCAIKEAKYAVSGYGPGLGAGILAWFRTYDEAHKAWKKAHKNRLNRVYIEPAYPYQFRK